jgi:hypothetical protein
MISVMLSFGIVITLFLLNTILSPAKKKRSAYRQCVAHHSHNYKWCATISYVTDKSLLVTCLLV